MCKCQDWGEFESICTFRLRIKLPILLCAKPQAAAPVRFAR